MINNLYSMVDQIFIGQGVNSNAVGGTTGVQLCASTLFQSIGKPALATIISLTENVIFLIPFMFVFAHCFGVYGVLWGGFAADICASSCRESA